MRLAIRQVEHPRPGVRPRELVLDGNLGPLDSLGRGGSQRGDVEWLPGSEVAAPRLDGPEERPTDFRFVWRGREFAPGDAVLDGRPLSTIDDIVDALDGFRRDTALIEVTWRGRAQRAKIESFEPDEGFEHEFDATLTVQWIAPPGRRQKLGQRGKPSPISFADQLFRSFEEALDSIVASPPVTFVRQVVDDIERDIDRLRVAISQTKETALALTNTAQAATGVTRSIAATIQQVMIASDDVIESAAVSADQLAQTDDAALQIRARFYRGAIVSAALGAKHRAAIERRRYRSESDVLAIYEAVQGDTIWSVSLLWYGDRKYAQQIAQRNNLISSALRAGQRIVIPVPEAA